MLFEGLAQAKDSFWQPNTCYKKAKALLRIMRLIGDKLAYS
jgi:hypothetical protein